MRAALRGLRPYLAPGAIFLVALLAVCWRTWTPIDGARKAFGWDAQWEYWGDLAFQVEAYRAGEAPLWNPFDRAGYPLHADPQAGVLYPLNWPLVAAGLALGETPFALVAIKTILHLWLAAMGMWAFLRRRGAGAAACYAGGFVLVLGYPFVHNSFSALNWSAAWVPWILLAVDAWGERPTRGRAALVGLTLGLAQLAGALAAFWYGLLIVGPYAAWSIVHHARASADRRAYLRAAAAGAAIAAAIFVALIAAQTTATLALLPHTVRDARDLAFVTTTAFGPDDLVGFAIPRFPGEACYVGLAALAWAALAVTLRPSGRRLVLAGVALLGVACAFGDVGPFLPFEASALPAFGLFRRAHRYLYVAGFAIAILAGEGLDELARLTGRRLRRRVVVVVAIATAAIATALAVGVVLAAPARHADASPYRDAYAFGLAAALASGWITVLVAWTRDGRRRRALAAVAATLLALDLAMAQAPKLELNLHPVPTPDDAIAQRLPGGATERRIYDREVLGFRPGARLGVRDLGGYEGDPLALARYARFLAAAQRAPRLLGHANVRWLLERGKTRTKPRVLPTAGLAPLPGVPGAREVPAVAPAIAWYDAAIPVPDGDAALARLADARPGTIAAVELDGLAADVRARAIVDGGRPPVAGRIVAFERNRIVAEIDAPDDGVVVVAEAFHPGWEATVDGRPAPIAPADGLLRAVPVAAGAHRLELRYRAPGYLALAALVPLALVVVVVLVVRERRRERR